MARTKQAVVLPEEPIKDGSPNMGTDTQFRGFRTVYNSKGYTPVGTTFVKDSLTDQLYKQQTDVNYLLLNYGATPRVQPIYGEQDYNTTEEWQNEVAKIKRRFLHLTPEERQRFGSPQKFFEFCSNPDNYSVKEPQTDTPVPPSGTE